MTASDNDSGVSEAPATTTTPFTIAARSTTSSKPARHTRNIQTRRPVAPAKVPKRRRQRPSTPRPSDDHSSLLAIPVGTTEIPDEETEEKALYEDSSEDSEAPENSALQTPHPESSVSQGSGKRARAKTSVIHEYITVRNGKFQCNRCSKTYSTNGGTGAISRHLKTAHSIDPTTSAVAEKRLREGIAINAAILRGAEINIEAEEKRRKEMMGSSLDKTTLEYLYLQWTVTHDIPFKQVRSTVFRTFLEYINLIANRMLPNSDSTMKIHAEGLFAEGKKRLRHMLATAISDIHITCDMWTSSNHLGLLAVVAHFTSELSELQTVTLALVELQGEHSGLNQALLVLKVLEDYGIRNKLGYMVMDNAHTNDTLISVIAEALREEGVLYDPQQRRLRCNGHVINLAVQAFLFGQTVDDYEYTETDTVSPSDAKLKQWRKLGPLGKLHNIIVWIVGSPQRIQSFLNRSGGLMPHRDNGTRWNSWYLMLNWAIQRVKGAIIAVSAEETDLQKDSLTAEEWKMLGHIRDFLINFHDATKATEGHKATLEEVLPTMDFLANTFEDAIEEFADNPFMHESLQAGYTKLLKYWNKTERSPAYIAAIVLDPTVKWQYFESWNPEWQPNMKAAMKEFWETKYRSSTGVPSYEQKSTIETRTLNKYLEWRDKKRGQQAIGDEFDQYIRDPMVLRKEGRSTLAWWLESE